MIRAHVAKLRNCATTQHGFVYRPEPEQSNGVVDEETQKNDLDIVREVLNLKKDVPISSAYDFSFAKKADSELTQAGWKP